MFALGLRVDYCVRFFTSLLKSERLLLLNVNVAQKRIDLIY